MKKINNIPVWGDPVDEGALQQIQVCAKDAYKTALMADHHLGYAVPIGGVVAYRNKISPSGVGFDIACGNMAVLTDLTYADIKNRIKLIADDIFNTIEFGIGRKNATPVDHELFDDPAWDNVKFVKGLKKMAQDQLGTVGSGNHYVDVFKDRKDRIWVGVHFGSRGLGHKIATYFLEKGGAKDGMHVQPLVLEADSQIGLDYLQCMELGGRYAYAGREWVTHTVVGLLGAKILDTVHNHHNFAWREKHSGEPLWVVRKGATPAFPGQRGFVGGSMGDISVILEGKESPQGKDSLYSTVHGAGRVMSRSQAKRGAVSREDMKRWIKEFNSVELRGAGVDESPHCYKRIEQVLKEHAGTIEVKEVLMPLIVCMAGENEIDPYKD